MIRTAPLLLLAPLLLGGCAATSQVAVLEPGVFAITTRGGTQATMAERGVRAANSTCEAERRVMAPVRSEIGRSEYRIAFRCLFPNDPILRGGIVPLPREEAVPL